MAGTYNDDNIALYGWPVHSSPNPPPKKLICHLGLSHACFFFGRLPFVAGCCSSVLSWVGRRPDRVAAWAKKGGMAAAIVVVVDGKKEKRGEQLASQSANTGGGGGGPKAMKGGEGKPLSRMQREGEEVFSLSCREEEEGIACIQYVCVWIGGLTRECVCVKKAGLGKAVTSLFTAFLTALRFPVFLSGKKSRL